MAAAAVAGSQLPDSWQALAEWYSEGWQGHAWLNLQFGSKVHAPWVTMVRDMQKSLEVDEPPPIEGALLLLGLGLERLLWRSRSLPR